MEGDPRAAGDSRKRRRGEQPTTLLDLLSALPDSLLLHILSFLRVEDVIPTALLSRRWRHLWTSTPCLDFYRRPRERWDFDFFPPDLIDRALILHEGTKIRTFRAFVDACRVDSEGILRRADFWVRFALRRRVEELELNWDIGCEPYKLPACVFSCESLVSLRLGDCHLEPPSRISMNSLRILTLCRVTMDEDDNLEGLLSGCPSLEYLTLEDVSPYSVSGVRVEGSNSRLRTLEIRDNRHLSLPGDGMLISAPSIKELILVGYLKAHNLKDHFTSIVTARLDLRPNPGVCYDNRGVFARLLRDLSHVKALKLSSWCVQALPVEVYETKFNIISLELAVAFITSEFRGIFIALQSFTKLEYLTIDITCESDRITSRNDKSADKGTTYVMSKERSSATMLQHLKTVTIFGLAREVCWKKMKLGMPAKYQNGLEFIRFLLKNSPALERLTINAVDHVNKLTERRTKILFGFASRLLALPRASPNAVVIIRDS